MSKFTPDLTTTIDLLRHGRCEGGDIYRGSTDVPLSQAGWRQMDAAVALDPQPPWQRIITSPLQRCRQFSEARGSDWDIPVTVHEDFREMHFGDWEGRSQISVWEEDTERVRAFYKDPSKVAPPNGEAMSDFQWRLVQAWKEVLQNHIGEHLLLVQHGGSIRVLLAYLLQMPIEFITRLEVPYAAISRVKVYGAGETIRPVLVFHNATVTDSVDK